MVNFTVYGEPMGKGRHRTTRQGINYTPAKTANYENLVKLSYTEQHAGKKLDGQLSMYIKAYFSIPKSTSKKKQEQMRGGEIRPTKKPDTDNIGKIICDSLNHVAYDDDKQIVSLTVDKFYSDNPKVEVEIRELLDK